MKDALETLRSFRPEAAGPTDALRLQERIAFMETMAHAPTAATCTMPRLRRRRTLVLVVALALTAVGAAGAAGIIPDDVQQALGLVAAHSSDTALLPEIDQAVERTSAPTADGGALELWTAPTTGGGSCAYLRRLDASGVPTDSGPISCAVTISDGGKMGEVIGRSQVVGQAESRPTAQMTVGSALGGGVSAQIEIDASGASTVFGQAPTDVAKVDVVDSSGAVLGEAAASDGWFVLPLPEGSPLAGASIVALSASGKSVGSVPTAIMGSPTAASTGSRTDSTSGTEPA